jgi:hypothetical protein
MASEPEPPSALSLNGLPHRSPSSPFKAVTAELNGFSVTSPSESAAATNRHDANAAVKSPAARKQPIVTVNDAAAKPAKRRSIQILSEDDDDDEATPFSTPSKRDTPRNGAGKSPKTAIPSDKLKDGGSASQHLTASWFDVPVLIPPCDSPLKFASFQFGAPPLVYPWPLQGLVS